MSRPKNKPDAARDAAQYTKHRINVAEANRAASRAGRDIGELPPVKDPARRERGRVSYEAFCREYFPDTFKLAWSPDHLEAIQLIEQATIRGGLFAYAMPRGSGKTSLAERAPIWATFYGYRLFPLLIGSDESSALELLATIKTEITSNDRLAEDFPEIVYPIKALENIAHRAPGQLYKGKSTKISWTNDQIILPTIPGSIASGALIATAGITGRIRGMKFKRSDGQDVRPDLVVFDDPQTDESARSPTQCATRVRLIRGAVLGLAGPGKRISAIMPCTVIARGDMSDQMLSRKKHPEWRGKRAKMVYQWPDRADLWEQYRNLRAESMYSGDLKLFNDFYKDNRAEMDKGAAVAWDQRFNKDELSAIQHAMNLRFDLGDEAFMAEYQNEPMPDVKDDPEALTADAVAAKVNTRPRGIVPLECTRLTAFIDVQKELLYYVVCGFDENFGGAVVDYGTWPDQKRSYFSLNDARHTLQRVTGHKSTEAALRAGLDRLAWELLSRDFKREDGSSLRIERCPVDANWGESTDLIYEFCRASPFGSVLIPSHGRYVGATSRSFGEYRKQQGDRIGLNWRMPAVQGRRSVRYLLYDTNWWKSFVISRFRSPIGSLGSLAMFGNEAQEHRMFADHILSEMGIRVEARGRVVTEFKAKPGRPDNHLFDGLVGCHVAASVQGVTLLEQQGVAAPVKKRIRLSELQKQKQNATAR